MCLEAFANQANMQISIRKASSFHTEQMQICTDGFFHLMGVWEDEL